MTIWVRALSRVPISGRARTPSHKSHDRSGQLEQLLLLASDDVFAALLESLDGVEPELVEQQRRSPYLVRQPIRIFADLLPQQCEERLLEGEYKGARSPTA